MQGKFLFNTSRRSIGEYLWIALNTPEKAKDIPATGTYAPRFLGVVDVPHSTSSKLPVDFTETQRDGSCRGSCTSLTYSQKFLPS